jgi:hypothetical protein
LAKGATNTLSELLSCAARLWGQGMGNFFAELKRCHIYRVAAYVVAPVALS